MNKVALALALLAGASLGRQAGAVVILDQLPLDVTVNATGFSSQFFGTPDASFDSAVVDDFAIASPTTLTSVSAALFGFGNFSGYGAVTAYSAEIYSSVTAAAASLTGDIASVTAAPAGVSLTMPFSASTAALIDIPLNISLGAGTFYLAVIAYLPFSNGTQIGVVGTGVGNAVQTNPAGGFGLPGNVSPLDVDAAYLIDGAAVTVPEPTTFGLFGLGLLTLRMLRSRDIGEPLPSEA